MVFAIYIYVFAIYHIRVDNTTFGQAGKVIDNRLVNNQLLVFPIYWPPFQKLAVQLDYQFAIANLKSITVNAVESP